MNVVATEKLCRFGAIFLIAIGVITGGLLEMPLGLGPTMHIGSLTLPVRETCAVILVVSLVSAVASAGFAFLLRRMILEVMPLPGKPERRGLWEK